MATYGESPLDTLYTRLDPEGIRRLPDITFRVNISERKYFEDFVFAGAPVSLQLPDASFVRGYVMKADTTSGMGDPHVLVTLRPTGPQSALAATLANRQPFLDALRAQQSNDRTLRLGHHYSHADFVKFITNAKGHEVTGLEPPATIVDDPPRRKDPVKIRNRFYVTAPRVTGELNQSAAAPVDAQYVKHTMAEAIADGERRLREDPNLDHVAISQIVRVIRRPEVKLVVEVVK